MPTITCPKCGHVNPAASGLPADACPRCGVIYAKARADAPRPLPATQAPQLPRRAPATATSEDFLGQLRAQSHYPAFRAVVGLLYLVGLVLAVGALVGAGIAVFNKAVGVAIGAGVAAIVIFVLAKAAKEASLMLADLSDATVRMAQRQEQT